MADNETLRNISKDRCEEIGEYLRNTGLEIGTDWYVSKSDSKGYCEFIFENIENLSLSVQNSNVSDIFANNSVIDSNVIGDSHIHSFEAYNSTILHFDTNESELGESVISDTEIDNLGFYRVVIDNELGFVNTTAGKVEGEVKKK